MPISLQGGRVQPAAGPLRIREVIDLQPKSKLLGVARRNIVSPFRLMVLHQPPAAELMALLRRSLPTAPAAPQFVLRLTEFGATAINQGKLNVAAELGLEYYVQHPDSNYYLVARTYANDQQLLVAQPEQACPLLLTALLQQSLEQVARADWDQPGPAYTLAQLRQPVAAPAPDLRAARQPGVYRSFYEFRHNTPNQPGNVTVDARAYRNTEWQGKRAVDPALLTPEGRRVEVKDAWGFCDGQQVYIKYHGEYYLLEQKGSNIMFFAPDFGHDGSGLLSAGPPRKAFSLSMVTGFIQSYQGTAGAAASLGKRPTHLIVYRRRAGAALPVTVDGEELGQLGADQYVSIPWQATGQKVQLCVGGACAQVQPTAATATYLKLAEDGRAALREVPVREGAARVSRLADR
ncbi:hypothetical protein [Hymenobacter chitinivorans]|nr:hypothetical protein [Hymenobacter chitinivorans]